MRVRDVGDRDHALTLPTLPPAVRRERHSVAADLDLEPPSSDPGAQDRHGAPTPTASSVSGGRSGRSNTTSDGPAPETHTGTWSRRSAATTSATSGIEASRASSWRRSTSDRDKSDGSRVSACTSTAARPTFATASARETLSGRTPRAAAVGIRRSGTRRAGRRSGCGSSRCTESSSSAIVKPPNTAAATLSGWPSISAANANTEIGSASIPRSSRADAATTPATVAAADEPSPRSSGIRFRPRRASGASGSDSRPATADITRPIRYEPSVGSSSAPSPSQDTPGSASVSIVTLVAQVQRQAEAVEPRPEVRRRGRDADA